MGIYDRDYYRETSSGWWTEYHGRRATLGLMLLIGLVFVVQVFATNPRRDVPDRILSAMAFDFADITSGEIWRLLTSHFVHSSGDLLQVALELFALYLFGTRIESIYSTREFLAFVLTGCVVVSIGKLLFAFAGIDDKSVTYGSGSIVTAIMVLFACHFPYERITLLIVPVPAFLLVGGIIALDLLGALGGGFGSAGYVAHLIGATFAFVYYSTQWRISVVLFPRWLLRTQTNRKSHLKLFTDAPDSPAEAEESVTGVPTDPNPAKGDAKQPPRRVDEQLEAKLDLVLEKVSRLGRDSLTTDEQAILQQASEIYQRRRRN